MQDFVQNHRTQILQISTTDRGTNLGVPFKMIQFSGTN